MSAAARSLVPVCLLLLGACALVPAKAPAAGERLHALVEGYFEETLRLDPVRATFIGDRRFDDQLGNPASPEHEAATRALQARSLAEARAIDAATLDENDRVTLEMFVWQLERAVEGQRFPQRLLPLDQMGSMASLLARLGSGEGPQPLDTVAEHEAWLRRASGFPAWVDSAILAMRDGQKRGITQPRVVMQRVLGQLEALAAPTLSDSLFAGALERLPPSLEAGERARLLRRYEEVIGGEVLPAYARLRDFVRDEHLPRCRDSVGWSGLPDGAAWYALAAARSTTLSLPPEEIHEIGLREVARIRGEMEQVMAQVGFEGDLQAFFAHVREDPGFYFESPEALLQSYRELKVRIDGLLPRLFSDFPKADYEVRPTEAFRAASAAGAEYQRPAPDGSRPGIFYVNTFNLKAQPKYGLETLSLHEAAPGHHFQLAIQQELPRMPRFRRFASLTAFSEGWALYAESLGRELGLFTDPMQYYGRLNDEQLRAMRLAVDTGLHTRGWSREQAIRFMLENSSLAESDVTAEVERYIVWPGQALGYKLGQLELTRLRAKAEEALGERFDLKAWHSVVLRGGSMPLELLGARLGRWVEAQRVR